MIQSIAQQFGIKMGLSLPLSLANDNETHAYCYMPVHAFPANALLKETIDYYLAHRRAIRDRRVAFLVVMDDSRCFAFSLELTQVDQAIVDKIENILNQDRLSTADDVLKKPELATLFRQLHKQGKCAVLGLAGNEMQTIFKTFAPLVETAYHLNIPATLLPYENTNNSALLLGHVCTLLKSGTFNPNLSITTKKKPQPSNA